MNIPRKLGIMVFTAVPAIVGGGVVYAISGHSYAMVALFELLLYAGAATVAINSKA